MHMRNSMINWKLEAGQKELYRLAKQRERAGKDVQLVKVIKDENGVLLSSEEDVRQRWKNLRNFEKLSEFTCTKDYKRRGQGSNEKNEAWKGSRTR